ncbi:phosphotransferase [Corynebacterium mendelii]|uniref:Phosphotransferase n=1 Tax=Corynebacterium mendelii TaxID=2765362 RepID=A0A939E0B6_9CORY|nr:phosphotransferase [Corynebacterium mendelii]MBN9643396.1 phosphotransferase [Corynebacterium mendelii]
MRTTDEIVGIAEELLTNRFGGTQNLTDPEDLGGLGTAKVLRCRVAPSPFLQARSVVLKFVPLSGDLFDDAALVREVVSYQFTTSLPTTARPGPELLAYDIDRRILVIGDAGDGETFDSLLQDADPAERMKLIRLLGRAIGSMHAATADREEHFDILFNRMLTKYPDTADIHRLRDQTLLAAVDRGLQLVTAAGIPVPEIVTAFAIDAKRRLSSGRHRAFTPFDLSPDNILMAGTPQFLDYEWAGFRDAAYDVACVVGGFPQYLFANPLSDAEAEAFIAAWVGEVKDIWPNVTNPVRLRARIITALIGWALSSIAYLYHGSMAQMVQEMEISLRRHPDDPSAVPDMDHLAMATATDDDEDVLAGSLLHDMGEDGQLARRDLHETFSALSRLAARGGDPRFAPVKEFADTVLARLEELGATPTAMAHRNHGADGS